MNLAAVLAIVNAAAPGVMNLVLAIKHTDGTTTTLAFLDQADPGFHQNIDEATAWLAAHGKATAVSPAKTTP